MDNQRLLATNYTKAGHILYPGKVERYVIKGNCGKIILRTIGTGFHNCGNNNAGEKMANLNEKLGKRAFENVDVRFLQDFKNR